MNIPDSEEFSRMNAHGKNKLAVVLIYLNVQEIWKSQERANLKYPRAGMEHSAPNDSDNVHPKIDTHVFCISSIRKLMT